MFRGYLRYAGTEVANVERLLTYVRNGVVDPDVTVETPAYCPDGIRAAVGDGPYRTPILDSPPWYDLTDGDSGDFAGLLVTDVTGAWGSTKTTTLTERAGDGAIIGTSRAASKALAVTAIGIARSQCGIDAGIAWLSAALHPPCSDPEALGNGGALEFFTCCPDTTCPIPDPLADTTDIASTIELTVRYPYTPVLTGTVDYLVGGGSGPGPGYVAGGDADPETDVYVGGGALVPGAEPDPHGHENEEGFFAGQVTDCGTEQLVWDLTIASPGTGVDPCRVAFAAVSPDGGTFLWVEPWQDLTPGHHVLTWAPVEVFDTWRPALLVQPFASVTVNSLTATERPLLTIDACVAPLRRSFQQVVTVDGPHVTATWGTDGEVTLAQIEWTWTAADPYVYADPIALATGVPFGSGSPTPTYTHPGVTVGDNDYITASDTLCPLPDATDDTCAANPACEALPAPPAAPVIPNPCLAVPTAYLRRGIEIDPDVTPASAAALIFTVTVVDGGAREGIRVRVYPDPDPDFGVADECAFSYEFTIDYLADGQTMTIDGASGRATVTCADGSVVNADVALSGAYGGPFTFPTIGCGSRVFIAVDVPGSFGLPPPGTVLVDLAMTRREG